MGQHPPQLRPSHQGDPGMKHTRTHPTCSTLAPGGLLGHPRPRALLDLLAHVCFVSNSPTNAAPVLSTLRHSVPHACLHSSCPTRAPCDWSSLRLLAPILPLFQPPFRVLCTQRAPEHPSKLPSSAQLSHQGARSSEQSRPAWLPPVSATAVLPRCPLCGQPWDSSGHLTMALQ